MDWAEVAQAVTTSSLIAVSGTGPTNIEAISAHEVLHFNGTSWSAASPPTNNMTGLWFDATGIRWLSNQNVVYRRGPLGETAGPPTPHISRLRGWATDVHVIGNQAILRYQP
jgi:hypothetical protein